MKKFYTLSLLIFGIATFAQAVDPFLGTGALNANGWTTHSGATPGQIVIIPGSLNYPGITSTGNKTQIVAGNSEDVNLPSSTAITGVAYFSTILNVLNTDGLALNTDPAGNYFLSFGATAGATSISVLPGRLYIKAGTTSDTFNLGVLNNSGGTVAPSYLATDFPIDTAMFIVVKYDLATNTASLFVNPPIGVSETAPSTTNATGTGAAPTQIASIAIREAGNVTAGTGNVELDEIRLGLTWEFVTSGTLRNNQNSISGLQVYPNPVTNGNLYITTDNNGVKSVNVYDVLGKLVVKTTVTDQPVNVSNLKGGVYIVKITEDGKTATRKLVIK